MTLVPAGCVELAQNDHVKSLVSVICGIVVLTAFTYWLIPSKLMHLPRVGSLIHCGLLTSVPEDPPGAKFPAFVPEVSLSGQYPRRPSLPPPREGEPA